MQNEFESTHATMVSPSAGFTARVMARVQERERARARRRAAVGAALLVAAAIVLVTIVVFSLWTWVSAMLTNPAVMLEALITIVPIAGELLNSLGITALTVFRNADTIQVVVFAAGVLVLTAIWARAATGAAVAGASTGLAQNPLNIRVGGLRK